MTSWHDCLSALDELANLKDGWHGPESLSPRPGQVTFAWRLLRCFKHIRADLPQTICLNDAGNVVVEWRDKEQTFRLETITASLSGMTLIRVGECADYFQVTNKG